MMENQMREALRVLRTARDQHISLFLEEGRLRYRTLTHLAVEPGIVEDFIRYKTELISLLSDSTQLKKVDWKATKTLKENSINIPVSFNQEQMLFLNELGYNADYLITGFWQIEGLLSISDLRKAFLRIIDQHEILRTIYYSESGLFYQRVMSADCWDLQIKDYSHTKLTIDEIKVIAKKWRDVPVDLTRDYALKACLFRIDKCTHYLLLAVHHIAIDGASWNILLSDLGAAYSDLSSANDSGPVQYSDFAFYQRTMLSESRFKSKLDYWKHNLSGYKNFNIQVNSKGRSNNKMSGGTMQSFKLGQLYSQRLRDISKANGKTLFMTLLSALDIFLFKYSGQRDICVGTPALGRTVPGTETMLGFFVNTLPLRTIIPENISFTGLLKKVRDVVLNAFENQEVPFALIVREVLKTREITANPLFQVVFAMEEQTGFSEPEIQDITFKSEYLADNRAPFDLTFTMADINEEIVCRLNYSPKSFTANDAKKILNHYKSLLIGIAENPETKVDDFRIFTEDDRLLYQDLNSTQQRYPLAATIIDLFNEQVKISPFSPAVSTGGRQLSYHELAVKSQQLAEALSLLLAGQEKLVGVCMDRSSDLIIAILAILYCGAAYVPLDPAYPDERLKYLIEDTALTVIFSDADLKEKLQGFYGGRVYSINELPAKTTYTAARINNVKIKSDDLAYIMYTSGTSGKPKGVMIEHGNIVSLVKGSYFIEITAADKILSTGSPSFDAVTFEYWAMLLNGGELIMETNGLLLNNRHLKNLIRQNSVSVMWFTVSWFNQLVDNDYTIFKTLTAIIIGGEKVSDKHVFKLAAFYPSLRIYNGYGPTENTTFSLTHLIQLSGKNAVIPIGRPLQNRTAYLLDNNNQLVPCGLSGEICVGGAGIARGYWNNPDLTNEKFVLEPWNPGSGRRVYRTGDIGMLDTDGIIYYQGRMDSQIKIRGQRIELAEIENCVIESGLVDQCIVTYRREPVDSLTGYVVSKDLKDKTQLHLYVKSRLPDHMVPGTWIYLDSIPLTENGKADIKSLPVTDNCRQPVRHQGPRNNIDRTLISIFQTVMNVRSLGIEDNFFLTGGHSLLIAPIIHHIERKLHVATEFRDFFVFQTIRDLSDFIAGGQLTARIANGRLLSGDIKSLNDSDSLKNLFLLPGSPGFCEGYKPFAIAFESQFRVFGVQLPGLTEQDDSVPDFCSMAANIAQSIRNIDQAGPYRLVGHSFGAYLAFEVASILEKEGLVVEFLCLIDAAKHEGCFLRLQKGTTLDQGLIKLTQSSLKGQKEIDTDGLALELLPMLVHVNIDNKAAFIYEFVSRQCPAETRYPLLKILRTVLRQALMSLENHSVINAQMLVVKAAEEDWSYYDNFLGWETYSREPGVVTTNGNHFSLITQPHVSGLVDLISNYFLL